MNACDREPPLPEAADPEDLAVEDRRWEALKKETAEATRAASDYLRAKAEETRVRLTAALERWDGATYEQREGYTQAAEDSLERLDREWSKIKGAAAGKSEEALARTERLREEAARKLGQAKEAGSEAWPEFREGFRRAFDELARSVGRAEEEIRTSESGSPAEP